MNFLVCLSTEQVVSLTTVQVSALSPRAVDGLLSSQLIALETKQIAALTSAQLRGLSTDSLVALSTLQYTALTTAQIASLTTGQIPSLETADIVALGTAQVMALSTAQVQALSTSGMAAMESVDLRAMTTAQIAALTTAQVVGLVAASANPTAISILVGGSSNGNIGGFVNRGGYDTFVSKFDSQGKAVWTISQGTSTDDGGGGVARAKDGSIYAAGFTSGNLADQSNHGDADGYLSKYDENGNLLWTKLIGTTADDKITNKPTVAPDGSIYVAGYTFGDLDGNLALGNADIFVTKFQADGTKVWTKTLGSAEEDVAYSLTTDLNSAIYVTGYTKGSLNENAIGGIQDGFIAKILSNGDVSWVKTIATAGADVLSSAEVAADGSVYAVGGVGGPINNQPFLGGANWNDWPPGVQSDALIVKYDTDGNLLWTKTWGTSASDAASDLALSADGKIFVTGNTGGNLDGNANYGQTTAFVSSFSSDGTKLNTALFGNPTMVWSPTISVGSDGKLYLSAYTAGINGTDVNGQSGLGQADGVLAQLNADGTTNWTKVFGTGFIDGVAGSVPYADFNGLAPWLLLTANQVSALTPAQINSLGAANLMPAFGSDQIAVLSTAQIAGLSSDSVVGLNASQIAAFKATQIAAMTPANIQVLSVADIKALTPAQIIALNSAQLSVLATSQVAALSTTDLAVMTTVQLGYLPCGLSTAQKAVLTTAQKAAYIATPIMLDLNGDGVQTLGLDAGVQFDVRANGLSMQTGWVSAQDGLLVMDRNSDGNINDGSELFGSSTVMADGARAQDGYQALAALDGNGDSMINHQDAVFAQLRVWVDANSDGLSAPDELRTLNDWGIASISTQAFASAQVNKGNVLGLVSRYQTTDGQTHQAADVWFSATVEDVVPSVARVNSLTQALGEFTQTQAAPSIQEAVAPSPTQPAARSALAVNQSLVAALQSYQGQAQTQQSMACANAAINPPANLAAMAAPVENSTRLSGVGLSPSDPLQPYPLASLR
jgi:hypothetical protein